MWLAESLSRAFAPSAGYFYRDDDTVMKGYSLSLQISIGDCLELNCMSEDKIHPNVARVTQAARDAGLEIEVRKFPEGTKTAQDAADAIGVTVGQIVKSLVFGVDDEIVMALVSGVNQLDEKKLAAAAGGAKCKRVDADAVREATGYAIGGVPPFGHSTQLRVFVDPDLLQYDEVWAAAGTWNDNFGANPNDIVRVAGGVVTDLKRG